MLGRLCLINGASPEVMSEISVRQRRVSNPAQDRLIAKLRTIVEEYQQDSVINDVENPVLESLGSVPISPCDRYQMIRHRLISTGLVLCASCCGILWYSKNRLYPRFDVYQFTCYVAILLCYDDHHTVSVFHFSVNATINFIRLFHSFGDSPEVRTLVELRSAPSMGCDNATGRFFHHTVEWCSARQYRFRL